MCDRNQGFFLFLGTSATSFMITTLICTLQCEWINILLRAPSIWFLLDRNGLRFSLHMAESVVREIQKPKRSMIVLLFFFNLLLVASLRSQFSLVYLCQFVFSASVLHFLVRWISRLIALWSKGVYIPSLHFFSENNHEPWPVFSRPLANEDLSWMLTQKLHDFTVSRVYSK